VIVGSRFRRKK